MSEFRASIPGAAGQAVSISLFVPEPARVLPLAIFVPGFKGFKDWGSWPRLAHRFAEAGLATLSVNLSHNGIAAHGMEFERLDLFEADTWGRRLDDMAALLQWVRSDAFIGSEQVDRERIALVGHSMGGGLALLVAAGDPGIRAVVTLAGISSVHRFGTEHLEQFARDGYASFPNARTGQEMRVGRALLDEIEADPERFDLLAAASRLGDRPLLIVQGDDDPAVSVADARALSQATDGRATLQVIHGAGHTFGAKHPPDGEPPASFVKVADLVLEFLARVLGPHGDGPQQSS